MNRLVYRYSFSQQIPMEDIEDSLMLAALATECLRGRCEVRLDAAFSLNKKNRTCLIDAESEAGFDIARIFTGFITKGYGEQSFTVSKSEEHTFGKGLLSCVGAAS